MREATGVHKRVLVVDDEEGIRSLLRMTLSAKGFEVEAAGTASAALSLVDQKTFDGIFCDIGLPDQSGLEVLKAVKRTAPECPVIIITAYASIETAIQAVRGGASDYIQKPFDPEEIILALEKVLESKRLLEENRLFKREISEKYDFSNIIGVSKLIKQLFERIKDAADTKSTVLILGESGTGKELFAKAIHYNSHRKNRPMVTIDCTSIPAHLMESELFGHVKGAFTGAEHSKKGLIDEADQSSLFLDEIGEIPLELQAKLLRVIQEGDVRPIGENRPHAVDIRVIAATNRDLKKAVSDGRFREDLYYRLNVIPLVIPPLRDRREDIPLLARHFLEKTCARYQKPGKRFSDRFMALLLDYSWPGNVREVENVIEQAVVLSHHELIDEADWPNREGKRRDGAVVSSAVSAMDYVQEGSFNLKEISKRVYEEVERQVILKALEKVGRNKTKASELLGISRRALISKVKGYGLE